MGFFPGVSAPGGKRREQAGVLIISLHQKVNPEGLTSAADEGGRERERKRASNSEALVQKKLFITLQCPRPQFPSLTPQL